jgi:photosystem II stability/assembly factor-like uncharacterized protein
MDTPYHVYGGLQDNGSWIGATDYPGGITNAQWESVYFGDGFWVFADPTDGDYVYAEAQGGNIARINRKTHQTRDIRPLPHYQEGKLRFNWNAPIHLSSSGAVYLGAQLLFRTRDHGQTWERISPDLTTNDPEKQKQELSGGVTVDNSAAEMHTTIYTVSESPRNVELIWAGTDDGNVQITRDGGRHWTNVAANVPGIPKNAWVSHLEASRFDEGTAYATFDAHTFGDLRPYVYRTTDYGLTWTALVAADSPMRGYAHVVREDPVDRDLLFVGTEFGLWISVDGGAQWAQYKGGELPSVPVRDVAIHPRDHDLVIATHGRGIWIVDDITPLRNLSASLLQQKAAFLAGRILQSLQPYGGAPNGAAEFNGETPATDAVITYYQRRRHIFGDLKIEILDAAGKRIETIPSSKRRGLSRVTWSMRMPPPPVPNAATAATAGQIGPRLLPGPYTIRMTKDGEVLTTKIDVKADPRWNATDADRKAQFDLAMKLYATFTDMTYAVAKINGVRDALTQRAAALPAGDVRTRLETAAGQLDTLRKRIVATKEGGMLTGEERLRENLDELYINVVIYEGRPSETQTDRAAAIARELADTLRDFDTWTEKQLPALNTLLGKNAVKVLTREAWEKTRAAEGGGAAGGSAQVRFERD